MDSEDFNFVFPQKLEDLCTYNKNKYVVSTDFNANEVAERIPDIFKTSSREGPAFILKDFDVFYGVLKHFGNLSCEVREQAWKCVLRGAQDMSQEFQDELNESMQNIQQEGSGDIEDRKRKCNILKMTMYIYCNLIEQFEERLAKESTVLEAVVMKAGRGRKNTAASKKSNESLDWDRHRERGIETLSSIAFMSLNKLFATESMAKDELINLINKCCFSVLTNPANKGKDNTKKNVYDIIANSVSRHNYSLNFCIKVMQLLQAKQCTYMKDLILVVEKIVVHHDRKLTVSELVQEMSRVDITKETSVKTMADFIKDLGERIPGAFIPCITTLLDDFLDSDAYMLRSATLSVIGAIISSELSSDDISPRQKKLRDELLDKLEERLMDVTTFTRGRAIQVWTRLCSECKIPLTRLDTLIESIVKRLRDKSGYVRKAVVVFLTEFLKQNPFAAKLSLERLETAYTKEKARLDQMMGKEGSQEERPLNWHDKWKMIEPKFVDYYKGSCSQPMDEDYDDEDPKEEEGENSSGETAINVDSSTYKDMAETVDTIRTLVEKNRFRQTVEFVRELKKKFDKDPVFQAREEEEEESGDEDEENESESLALPILYSKRIFLTGVQKNENNCLENMNDARRMEEVARNVFDRGSKRKKPEDEEDEEDITEPVEQDQEEGDYIVNDLSKQQILVKYLGDCVSFAKQIKNAIPDICSMLGSKTITDSQEAIDFFVTAYEFGVEGSLIGIRKMITLVFSSDRGVRDAVIEAYKKVYLTSSSLESLNDRQRAVSVVKNLMELVEGASMGEIISLEELLKQLVETGDLGSDHVRILFEKYARKQTSTSEQEARTACQVISMLSSANKKMVLDNIDTFVTVGLTNGAHDSQLVQLTLSALQKAAVKEPKVEEKTKSFRLEKHHPLFHRIHALVVDGIANLDDMFYIPMSNEAIKTIYSLSEQPDLLMEEILHEIVRTILPQGSLNESRESLKENEDQTNTITLTQPLTQPMDGEGEVGTQETTVTVTDLLEVPSEILCRFMSIIGDIALNHLIYIESSVVAEIKIRKYIKDCREAEKKGKKAVPPTTSKRKSTVSSTPGTNMEEEIGLAGASAVEDEIEQLRVFRMIDDKNNLLSKLCPLLTNMIQNPDKFSDMKVKNTSSLALAKFMLCSQSFCKDNLRLLFTVLQRSEDPLIRQNAIISLGDLCVRYPNLLDPWTSQLYSPLNDPDVEVRRNSLKVLSRLILSDMVKVKGQIFELAKIIVDDDDNLSSQAKLFFSELKKKENAIYNVLPDIISNLSGGEKEMDERKFQDVMTFMIPLIDKDKQVVSLIDKVCQRFRTTHDERQWRDLTFCLTKMKFTESGVKMLYENMICFADKLSCDPVYEGFKTIVDEAEKLNIKDVVDSFKAKMNECRSKGVANEDESEIQKVVGTPPSSAKKLSLASSARKLSLASSARKLSLASSARKLSLASARSSTVKKTLDKTKKKEKETVKKTRTKGKRSHRSTDLDEEEEDSIRIAKNPSPPRESSRPVRPVRSVRRGYARQIFDADDDSD